MHQKDRKNFAGLMTQLQILYNRESVSWMFDLYWESFEHYTFEQIAKATKLHLKDEKCGMFFPLPANILAKAKELKDKECTESGCGEIGQYSALHNRVLCDEHFDQLDTEWQKASNRLSGDPGKQISHGGERSLRSLSKSETTGLRLVKDILAKKQKV